MDKIGYVKLHRKLFINGLWLSEKFTKAQAWIDLFANANHTDGSFWVRGNEVKIKRGQIGWSEVTMAKRWGWSRDKVRRFLKYLVSESNIRQQKTTLTSIITIINYEKYQDLGQRQDISQDIRQDSRQDTNKNDNNDNNDKNKIKISAETSSAEPKKTKKEKLDDKTSMNINEFVEWCRKSTQRHIKIIGEYADEKKIDYKTKGQWYAFILRNLRSSRQLSPYSDEQISKSMKKISFDSKSGRNQNGFITRWTLETLLKYLE